jgi:putative transposase
MARLPRLFVAKYPHHVVQRGNNRNACFLAEQDFLRYLEFLRKAAEKYEVAVHAYVLMTNHVHLLVTPAAPEGISGMMQSLGRRYVRYFNDRYHRTGTLWEGRFHGSLVQDDHYLLACYQYIELNPVRAGMVNDPAAYRWSSYGHNALGKEDPLVTPHSRYLEFGRSPSVRCKAYRKMVASCLDPSLLDAVRDAARGNRIFGTHKFVKSVEALLSTRIQKRPRGPLPHPVFRSVD